MLASLGAGAVLGAFAGAADVAPPPMLEKRPEVGAEAGAGAVVVAADEPCDWLAPPPMLNSPAEVVAAVLACEVLVELGNENPPVLDFSFV